MGPQLLPVEAGPSKITTWLLVYQNGTILLIERLSPACQIQERKRYKLLQFKNLRQSTPLLAIFISADGSE
jgi:hypothetical protein